MTQAFDAADQQALLETRAEAALALARRLGADACEVGASVDQASASACAKGMWKPLSCRGIRALR